MHIYAYIYAECLQNSEHSQFVTILTKVRNTEDVAGDIHNLTYFPLLRIWKLINKAERAILQSDFDQSQWKLTTFTFSESSSDFHLILLIFIGLFNLTLSLPENWF